MVIEVNGYSWKRIMLRQNGMVFIELEDGRQIEVHSNGIVYANDADGVNYASYDFIDIRRPV